jgi:hypothetical protein
MIPIGIITRNRPEYLDVTLRSLAGAELDADQRLVVFDDASDTLSAREYLYTPRVVRIGLHPQEQECWEALGLEGVGRPTIRGIGGRVEVIRLSSNPVGVVNASCRAICHLFASHPQASGIFLIQDDVVFKADWKQRMRDAAELALATKLPGVLAGMTLFRRPPRQNVYLTSERFVTAQCLYVPCEVFEALSGWFHQPHDSATLFDAQLCRQIHAHRFAVRLVHPFVCQHIGVQSLVHPRQYWLLHGKSGRTGYEASPPYALAGEVPQMLCQSRLQPLRGPVPL